MSAPRTFDYDYLKQLIRDEPQASLRDLADKLTEHERQVRGDPGYPRISPTTVSAAWSRNRDAWAERGEVPRTGNRVGGGRTQPWDNVPPQYWTHTLLRRLRVMSRLATGEKGLPVTSVRPALKLAKQLRDDKEVIDLQPSGRPYTRPARPDELDSMGDLIAVTARYPGLTQQMWEQLDPEGRRIASSHWLPPGREGGPNPADLRLDQALAS